MRTRPLRPLIIPLHSIRTGSLLSMNEIDREEILAQRQDEQNQIKVKHQLDQMVKDQSGRKDEGATRGTKRMTRVLSPPLHFCLTFQIGL